MQVRILNCSHIQRVVLSVFFVVLFIACDSTEKQISVDLSDRVSNESVLNATSQPSSTMRDEILIFGFDLRNSPSEDAKQYLPFIDYLSLTTGLEIELKFTPKGSDIATELGEGRIHLAAIGATSYILANEKYGLTILARGINKLGKAEYRSMIVVHPSSKITNLSDLKNRNFAFGSLDSTQGHLIPRIELANKEIFLTDLKSYEYTGSHLKCANSVISEQMDACGMQDTMAENFSSRGELSILFKSSYYPSSGIVANSKVKKETLNKLIAGLIEFEPEGKHKSLLYHWEKTEMPKGFVKADPKDYFELRKWMIHFGLLKINSESQ